MNMRQTLSVVLVLALVTSAVVAPTWAGPGTQRTTQRSAPPGLGTPTASPSLRASIDRAVVETLSAPRDGAQGARPLLAQQSSGGGGGGGGWLVWTLVGTAASLGMGYYLLKQMRKQTSGTPTAK